MPSEGNLAMRPKMIVKTSMVRNGRIDRPQRADHGLLVAHRQIAPREHLEQLTIAPQVEPVVALLAAGLKNNGLWHVRENLLLQCTRCG